MRAETGPYNGGNWSIDLRVADLLDCPKQAIAGVADDDVRLLHRTTRSVAPTEAGERLLKRLAPVLGDLDEALHDVSDDSGQPSGTLRIGGDMRFVAVASPAYLAENSDYRAASSIAGSSPDMARRSQSPCRER